METGQVANYDVVSESREKKLNERSQNAWMSARGTAQDANYKLDVIIRKREKRTKH